MAAAVQVVLQADLATSQAIVPVLANDDSGAYQAAAKSVVRATVTQRDGRISLNTAITDNGTQQNQRVIDLKGASSSGILPLLNELAKQIDNRAASFSTKSNRALEAYVNGASTTVPQQRLAALADAIHIDPSFGLAYLALADADAQSAPQALPALLQAAAGHTAQFTPLDRARFNAYLARYSHAPLAKQEAAFRAVLQVAPNESDALVTAGSLSFLRGNAADGTRYLQRALELNPGNVSVRKALADGLFETRRFAEAEKLLVGMDNNQAVLPELAVCVLLEGDAARANTIAERLFASIANPDAKTLVHAAWLEFSGQSQKAVELLSSAKFAQPAAQSFAYGELSVWQMIANDFAGAKQWASKAQQLDPRPGSAGSIVAMLAKANEPADMWKQEIESSFIASNEQLKTAVLGYGFFLGAHYSEAAQVWNAALQQSGDSDLRARAMLAASLSREGKADQAKQIKVEPFVPEFGDLYAAISFLEITRYLGIGVR